MVDIPAKGWYNKVLSIADESNEHFRWQGRLGGIMVLAFRDEFAGRTQAIPETLLGTG